MNRSWGLDNGLKRLISEQPGLGARYIMDAPRTPGSPGPRTPLSTSEVSGLMSTAVLVSRMERSKRRLERLKNSFWFFAFLFLSLCLAALAYTPTGLWSKVSTVQLGSDTPSGSSAFVIRADCMRVANALRTAPPSFDLQAPSIVRWELVRWSADHCEAPTP